MSHTPRNLYTGMTNAADAYYGTLFSNISYGMGDGSANSSTSTNNSTLASHAIPGLDANSLAATMAAMAANGGPGTGRDFSNGAPLANPAASYPPQAGITRSDPMIASNPYTATLVAALAAAAAAAYPTCGGVVPHLSPALQSAGSTPRSYAVAASSMAGANTSCSGNTGSDYASAAALYYQQQQQQALRSSAPRQHVQNQGGLYVSQPYSHQPGSWAYPPATAYGHPDGIATGWSTPSTDQIDGPYEQQHQQHQNHVAMTESSRVVQKEASHQQAQVYYTPPHLRDGSNSTVVYGSQHRNHLHHPPTSIPCVDDLLPPYLVSTTGQDAGKTAYQPQHLVNGNQPVYLDPAYLSLRHQQQEQKDQHLHQQRLISEFQRLAVTGSLPGASTPPVGGHMTTGGNELYPAPPQHQPHQQQQMSPGPAGQQSHGGGGASEEMGYLSPQRNQVIPPLLPLGDAVSTSTNSASDAQWTPDMYATTALSSGHPASGKAGCSVKVGAGEPGLVHASLQTRPAAPLVKTWANIASQPPKGSAAVVLNSGLSSSSVPWSSNKRLPTTGISQAYPGANHHKHLATSRAAAMLAGSANSTGRTTATTTTSAAVFDVVVGGEEAEDPETEALQRESIALHQRLAKVINPAQFDTGVEKARFFVIKSFSEDDIHRSIKYSIWCSTELGNKKLDSAYAEADRQHYPIFLFFSVNGSGHFCGMAEMTSRVDYQTRAGVWVQDKWQGKFSVRWIFVKDVPNTALRHIRVETNENKPVTHSRDTTELPLERGRQVMDVFANYSHSLSIFDDFLFYEQRERQESLRRKDSATRRD